MEKGETVHIRDGKGTECEWQQTGMQLEVATFISAAVDAPSAEV